MGRNCFWGERSRSKITKKGRRAKEAPPGEKKSPKKKEGKRSNRVKWGNTRKKRRSFLRGNNYIKRYGPMGGHRRENSQCVFPKEKKK